MVTSGIRLGTPAMTTRGFKEVQARQTGHLIADVLDKPPKYPLDLTYKTIRTFPGMKVTADVTKFKPMLHWPAEPDALYTVVLSNLDINNRKNRFAVIFILPGS